MSSATKKNHELRELYVDYYLKNINISTTARNIGFDRNTVRKYFNIFRNAPVTQSVEVTDLKSVKWWFESTQAHQNDYDTLDEYVSGWTEIQRRCYVYLLAQYFGDGHIVKIKNKDVYRLRIFNDTKYENLNILIEDCIEELFGRRPNRMVRNGCCTIYITSKNMVTLFPQYGAGKKHTRSIELTELQRTLITEYPKDFIVGCIHSDGCRVATQSRPFYQFTNFSLDIKRHFQFACGIIHIPITYSSYKNVYVYKQKYVKIIDLFYTPK